VLFVNRRQFICSGGAFGIVAPMALGAAEVSETRACDKVQSAEANGQTLEVLLLQLQQAADSVTLDLQGLSEPIVIKSMQLLQVGETVFVRTLARDGHEGISVTNKKVSTLYPIFLTLVAPVFIGQDARLLQALLEQVYRHKSNYKMQGLALWCCVAWAEMSILDLLGKAKGQHVSALFGGKVRDRVALYVASGNRETTAAQEIDVLQARMSETGAQAVKFKVGGRMSHNQDSLPQRSEQLIALSRKILGDDITIQADTNGSYDVEHAIKFGHKLQDINAYLFEEPCRFDHIEQTKQVADALEIPVSGGEQESSEYRFKQMLAKNVLQIVQPDLHYYGGFIRTTRLARMAQVLEVPITLHISDRNAGFAEMVNFSSFTPNIGKFQELKSGMQATAHLFDPPIVAKNGFLNVPSAPGLGMKHGSEHIKNAKKVISHS
jgi:L-alanine-DL-glutamate epimerase-like enolase superfamily enzyme